MFARVLWSGFILVIQCYFHVRNETKNDAADSSLIRVFFFRAALKLISMCSIGAGLSLIRFIVSQKLAEMHMLM